MAGIPAAALGNEAPTVRLASPLHGSFPTAAASLTLSAVAGDPDGTVAQVEFFQGTNSLGTDTNAPFVLILTNVSAGSYNYIAVATDNLGANATSLVASVTVVSNGTPVKIMPLGDSITDGFTSHPGGYRTNLWRDLTNAGFNINFVGSLTNGPPSPFDQNHEGHSGFTIADVTNNVANWLALAQPDIVLLLIGANDAFGDVDFTNATTRLNQLVDQIFSNSPNVHLVMSTITPFRETAANQRAAYFNSQVPLIFGQKSTAGRRISMVNLAQNFKLAQLEDGVHPNASGYNKMAADWYGALVPLLTGEAPPQVDITFPTNGTVFLAPTNLTITASALDPDGSIAKIEFYEGNVKLGEDATAPFSLTITNLTSGRYSFSVKATDNAGAQSSSTNVSLNDVLTFIYGVNMNGPAVQIDGYPLTGYADATNSGLGVTIVGGTNINILSFETPFTYGFPYVPDTDDAHDLMFRSAIYASPVLDGQGFALNKAFTNGFYHVYVWLLENGTSNFRDIDVKIEGTTFATGVGDLAQGHWRKYGPFNVNVSDAALDIQMLKHSKGEPVLFSFAVFKFTGTNTPPIISDITNQVIDEDMVVGPLTFSIADSETPAGDLVLSATSSNPTLVPTNNIVFGGTGNSRTVTITPATNQVGTNLITVIVTDSLGGMTSDSFTVTFNPVNEPTEVANQSLTNTVNQPLAVTLTANDPDGDIPVVTIVSAPTYGTLRLLDTNGAVALVVSNNTSLGTNTVLSYLPGTNFFGVDSFTYRANDGLTNSVLATVTITTRALLARGVNVNGTAVTIEGYPWMSYSDALANGLSVASPNTFGFARGPYGASLSPPWDPLESTCRHASLSIL